MLINWTDPTIQSATIQALGSAVSTLIAAICAAVIGKQIAGRKRLQEKLSEAFADIDFLLAVEAEHCQKHVDNGRDSSKIRIRGQVREKGLTWSGRHTPGPR